MTAISIDLGRGYTAWVDHEDAGLTAHRWFANVKADGRVYAIRNRKVGETGPKSVKLHRAVLGETNPRILVDHRDGDGLNCRRGNLRRSTKRVNARNVTGARKGRLYSRFYGVTYNSRAKRWVAQLNVNGTNHGLGYFTDEEEAHVVRLVWEKHLIGIEPRRLPAFQEYGLA